MSASATFWYPFAVMLVAALLAPRHHRWVCMYAVLSAGLLTHRMTHDFDEGGPFDRPILLAFFTAVAYAVGAGIYEVVLRVEASRTGGDHG